jgi:hypothetical protein
MFVFPLMSSAFFYFVLIGYYYADSTGIASTICISMKREAPLILAQ